LLIKVEALVRIHHLHTVVSDGGRIFRNVHTEKVTSLGSIYLSLFVP